MSNGYGILRKLLSMDRREFGHRSRQEFAKRTDAALSRIGYSFVANSLQLESCVPFERQGSFFFESHDVEPLLAKLRQRLPEQVESILARAERICLHSFDLLGYKNLDYGQRIDWHLDVVHGKRAPLKPFYRVKYLDFAQVGDSKITWELNRHQHLVILAKAYRLTGDRRYGEEILAQWQSWHAANPYPIGINWASTLEVGFRSISWIWMYQLLKETSVLEAGFREEWLRAQALNGRHLERYLSTYFSPNTHLLGEGVALFFLGALCSQLPGASRWRKLGWEIVTNESRRQVNLDGMHFEQSTYYHVYALDFFLHAVLLARTNGITPSPETEQIIEKMLGALLLLGSAGPPPRFGDDDGGRVFDAARNRGEDLLDPLAAGAILFNRGDFKALAAGLREETIWLLGERGIEEWDRISAKSPASLSTALEQSGLYAMTNSAAQLVIDGGASAQQSNGHNHADALSVCLQCNGTAMLIDPGTCEYVGPDFERDRFRGTAMHNTLRVDGKDQADPAGPFSWKQVLRPCAEQWISGESVDLFVGSHNGYWRLPSPVLHRRWVVALKSGVFLVRDLAEGQGEHRLDISWHLAPQFEVHGEHVFRFKNLDYGLAILPVQTHNWLEELDQSIWSPAYGQKSSATVLNFSASAKLNAEFATLLVPLLKRQDRPGAFTKMQPKDASESVQAYRYQAEDREHFFFFAQKERSWRFAEIASDAEFVCVTARPAMAESDLIFCNGSYAEVAGKFRLSTSRKVTRCERIVRNGVQVFCSEPDALLATTGK
jgi:hypothetical protein